RPGRGAVGVVAPRRVRPAARRDGDRRQRGLRAGVLLRPAHRPAVPPGGDPGDRRVVGAACHAAAGRGRDRAAVPRRGRRLAAGGRARARAVLRLAGRPPDRPEKGLTRPARVDTVDGTEALLAAFDGQARTESPSPPAGAWYERDGPLLRVVGEERGFISAPRDTGAGACVRSAAAAPARTRCCRPGRQRTRTCPTAAR